MRWLVAWTSLRTSCMDMPRSTSACSAGVRSCGAFLAASRYCCLVAILFTSSQRCRSSQSLKSADWVVRLSAARPRATTLSAPRLDGWLLFGPGGNLLFTLSVRRDGRNRTYLYWIVAINQMDTPRTVPCARGRTTTALHHLTRGYG